MFSKFYSIIRKIANRNIELQSMADDFENMIVPQIDYMDYDMVAGMQDEFVSYLGKEERDWNRTVFALSAECVDCDDPKYRFVQHFEQKQYDCKSFIAYIKNMSVRRFEQWINLHSDEYMNKLLRLVEMYPELAA